ncbi:hypothetical protein [Lentzea albidocapillata]|uniref:hypothetical protein n=1 Tax=Lentzea albidocapillata TaxID=40571 RepID=UPI00115FF3A0|nr:hypothetical protein [Lentzea albidocapillata]
MTLDPGTPAALAFAQFFRTVSVAAEELAQTLEKHHAHPGARSLEAVELGSLQRQVAEAPGMDSDEGVSPREIAKLLARNDEPNIRTALSKLQRRGVAELVPGPGPQRWRLAAQYRSA